MELMVNFDEIKDDCVPWGEGGGVCFYYRSPLSKNLGQPFYPIKFWSGFFGIFYVDCCSYMSTIHINISYLPNMVLF